MSLPSESQSLSANQISSRYLHWRLRYNYSGLEIQTSAILEFYFRFRSRPVRRNVHVIMHQAAEFRPNWSTYCRHMTSYPFLKMAAATAIYYFRFHICLMSLPSEGQSLLANQFSSRYLNWRLRYNYFRLRNTNVRHV